MNEKVEKLNNIVRLIKGYISDRDYVKVNCNIDSLVWEYYENIFNLGGGSM